MINQEQKYIEVFVNSTLLLNIKISVHIPISSCSTFNRSYSVLL